MANVLGGSRVVLGQASPELPYMMSFKVNSGFFLTFLSYSVESTDYGFCLQDMTRFQLLDRFSGQNQSKTNLSVSTQKTSYPNQLLMRNSNLHLKIARHLPF